MPWNVGGPGDTPGGSGDGGGDKPPGGPSPWGNPGSPGDRPGRDPRGSEPRGNDPRGPSRPPGGGGGRGPGGGGQPPDIDELIARAQGAIRGLLPSGFGGGASRGGGGGGGALGGGRGLALLGVLVVAAWLASGFYRVQPDEEGAVLRFGAFVGKTNPGLNYHIPWPVESVLLPAVTRINRVEVGYRSANPDLRAQSGRDAPSRDVAEEGLMLTGDENIIDINFAVFWRVREIGEFLFATRNPAYTVKSAAESVMREVIGRTPIQPALTDARARIESDVAKGIQTILDQYGSGVEITQVQLQKVDPPAAVVESFRDVQRANTDADTARNQAQSYANDIVPRARGDAARLVAEADGARQSSIAEATGQAQRFLSVLNAYNVAKEVTMTRLYIETMQDILTHTPVVVVDDKLQNVVPFLPLNDLGRTPTPAPPPAPAASPPPPPSSLRVPTR